MHRNLIIGVSGLIIVVCTLLYFTDNKIIPPKSEMGEITKDLTYKLQLRDFNFINNESIMAETKQLFNKNFGNSWNESVMIFSNDSSLFIFDIINDINIGALNQLVEEINTNELQMP
ncbi:MAG: hypothetical protein R6U04_12450 [Bacteroidales bacterium]